MSPIFDQFKCFLREIECPVCNEYLHTNIPVCLQGHSICSSCKEKCRECPTCKSSFGPGRNYILENLISSIRIPCNYKSDGCIVEKNFAEIANHLEKCEYRDVPCPLSKSHNCTWLGKYKGFKNHLKETHKNVDLNYTSDIKTGIFYMFYDKNTFKICRKYAPDEGLVTWVVQLLENKDNAKNYLFRVEFMDHKNSGMELSMTAECVSMCQDDQIFENIGISLPIKMLEYFRVEDVYTHRICIQNKKVM